MANEVEAEQPLVQVIISIPCRSWLFVTMEELESPTVQHRVLVVIVQVIAYGGSMQLITMPLPINVAWTEVCIQRLSRRRQLPCEPIRTYNISAYFEARRLRQQIEMESRGRSV